MPIRFLINQCQIITFLILKYDIIENSRIELRGIALLVQMGGLLGGPKGMLAPPLKLLGGGGPGLPSLYAYVYILDVEPPGFVDCPSSLYLVDETSVPSLVNINLPSARDNSGLEPVIGVTPRDFQNPYLVSEVREW